MMNNKAVIILITFLYFILSCNEIKNNKIIGTPIENCNNPSDAIVKFEKVGEDDLINSFFSYTDNQKIKINTPEKLKIENWIKDAVFSNNRNLPLVREWNINDEDICFIQTSTVEQSKDSSDVGKSVDIKICNSILNKNISAGNYWGFETDDLYVFIQYCFNNENYIKRVGYYAVEEKSYDKTKLERSLITHLNKYKAKVNIEITIKDRKNNITYYDNILSDNCILYTGFREFN
ncbi:hypothetical protein [uncultured Tenacibaculum sp.]|uniref:hypothetical protein n=1 Tax=uncultured Tenacibaculum sp. TaxID=174713 RepID=UPI0026168C4D|nr:hypothetical protein [uncultured Tenacibaculum sp.]